MQLHAENSQNLSLWTDRESIYAWPAFVRTKRCVTGVLLRESCNTAASGYMAYMQITPDTVWFSKIIYVIHIYYIVVCYIKGIIQWQMEKN